MSNFFGSYGSTSGSQTPWETQVVSEERRMELNGETPAQMAHAKAIKAAGGVSLNKEDGTDTSADQKWEYEDKPGVDRYVLVTTLLAQGIKLPVFLIILWIFNFVPTSIARLYIMFLPEPTERVVRSSCFYIWFTVAAVFSIPSIVLILVSLVLDYVAYYFFSLLFCACTWNWAQAVKGFELIAPYRGGPSIVLKMPDIFVAVMGQAMRQGLFETNWTVTMMFVLMPWLKYYICCNPYIYNLDNRMVQQISTTMEDCGSADEVARECRKVISTARQTRARAHRIDLWSFVPHYPLPPPDRRWAIGMQAGGPSYPGKFTLLVHTTHYDQSVSGSQEQYMLSNSYERPVYRVMLWYSNPFHFLTGWVEASISTGMPSQPQKNLGGEHPMWLVSGRTHLTSGRESYTGSGLIDGFFDYWLPVFVHEVRFATHLKRFRKEGDPDAFDKAWKIAEDKYQEVTSKDGISEACPLLGRSMYKHEDALSEYEQQGQKDHKDFFQNVDSKLGRVNQTTVGKRIGEMLGGEELIKAPEADVEEAKPKEV